MTDAIELGDTIRNTLDGGQYTVREITAGGRLVVGNGSVAIPPEHAELVSKAAPTALDAAAIRARLRRSRGTHNISNGEVWTILDALAASERARAEAEFQRDTLIMTIQHAVDAYRKGDDIWGGVYKRLCDAIGIPLDPTLVAAAHNGASDDDGEA